MLKDRIFRDVISAHVRLIHAHPKRHGRDHDIHPVTVCSSGAIRPKASSARESPPQGDVGAIDQLHRFILGRCLLDYIIWTQWL